MREQLIYIADDGIRFDTKAECLKHERVFRIADEFERRGLSSMECLNAARCLQVGWDSFKKIVEWL